MVLITNPTEIKMKHENEKSYREYIKLMNAKRFFLFFNNTIALYEMQKNSSAIAYIRIRFLKLLIDL